MQAGCATMAPITQEELGAINSVYLDFDFSEEVEYLHLGTTAFHNRSISFDGTKIKSDILNYIQNQITRKGYELVLWDDCDNNRSLGLLRRV